MCVNYAGQKITGHTEVGLVYDSHFCVTAQSYLLLWVFFNFIIIFFYPFPSLPPPNIYLDFARSLLKQFG